MPAIVDKASKMDGPTRPPEGQQRRPMIATRGATKVHAHGTKMERAHTPTQMSKRARAKVKGKAKVKARAVKEAKARHQHHRHRLKPNKEADPRKRTEPKPHPNVGRLPPAKGMRGSAILPKQANARMGTSAIFGTQGHATLLPSMGPASSVRTAHSDTEMPLPHLQSRRMQRSR